MKNNLLLILAVFLVVTFSFMISAQPPFVEEGATVFSEGYFVEYTPIGVYENSKDIKINAHVFNISNGREIDNSTTVCKFSLFNKTGNHVISNIEMTFDIDSEDWEFLISGGNFTKNGDYSYLVDCQDQTNDLGGFVAIEFIVTPSGNSGNSNIAFFILIILLIYGINLLGFFNENVMMTVLGGMALLFLGVYMINNGIIIYRDNLTNYVAYVTIAWGGMSSIFALYKEYFGD